MNQYIDVKRITDTLYLEDQTNVVIEFPVHSDQLSIIEPGGGKIKTCTLTYIFNIPKTHYVSFTGFEMNISVLAESGVTNPEKNGILYVSMINTSLESRTIPRGIQLGGTSIRKYSSFEDEV